MKKLQREGVGAKKRQVEVLTEANEELIWSKGLLGDTTLQSLLDTVILYNRLFFALRSGKEHRQLRSSPCQIEVIQWNLFIWTLENADTCVKRTPIHGPESHPIYLR